MALGRLAPAPARLPGSTALYPRDSRAGGRRPVGRGTLPRHADPGRTGRTRPRPIRGDHRGAGQGTGHHRPRERLRLGRPGPGRAGSAPRPAHVLGQHRRGGGSRPHRLRLAVAATRDQAQMRQDLLQPAATPRALPRAPLRVQPGRAVPVDEGRIPRPLRADREQVRSGRWEPVGGMWVEPDTNVPSGESLVRQLVYGKRFFAEEFGVETHELWIPDVFGYSAALPQIARGAGVTSLITQKMSWNDTNPFPHTSFWWEGHDGSRLLAHFPPANTYNGDFSVGEVAAGQDRGVGPTWHRTQPLPLRLRRRGRWPEPHHGRALPPHDRSRWPAPCRDRHRRGFPRSV